MKHLISRGVPMITRCDRRVRAVRSQGDTAWVLPSTLDGARRARALADPKLCPECRADVNWTTGGRLVPERNVGR